MPPLGIYCIHHIDNKCHLHCLCITSVPQVFSRLMVQNKASLRVFAHAAAMFVRQANGMENVAFEVLL